MSMHPITTVQVDKVSFLLPDVKCTLQVGWFCVSLSDPMGEAGPVLTAALSAGGEMVDATAREAERAEKSAEYRAMLQAAVDAGEAPPTCATRKLDDGLGGC